MPTKSLGTKIHDAWIRTSLKQKNPIPYLLSKHFSIFNHHQSITKINHHGKSHSSLVYCVVYPPRLHCLTLLVSGFGADYWIRTGAGRRVAELLAQINKSRRWKLRSGLFTFPSELLLYLPALYDRIHHRIHHFEYEYSIASHSSIQRLFCTSTSTLSTIIHLIICFLRNRK